MYGEAARTLISPRVCDFCRLLNASPIRAEVVLRSGEITIPRQGGGHCLKERDIHNAVLFYEPRYRPEVEKSIFIGD